MSSEKVIVIGNSTSATLVAARACLQGHQVTWVMGAGSHPWPILPLTEASENVSIFLEELAGLFGVSLGEAQTGSFLRDFRSKAFQPVAWMAAPNRDARREVRDELLWSAEQSIAPLFESRFEMGAWEFLELLRVSLMEHESVEIVEGIPVHSIQEEKVELEDGTALSASRIVVAESWDQVRTIQGLGWHPIRPRPEEVGAVQVRFIHQDPIGEEIDQSFMATPYKDSGETFERRVWGYFSDRGYESIWTVLMTSEEMDDNHVISKKIKRIKQTLNRVFEGRWPDLKEFTDSIEDEIVRVQPAMTFANEVEASTFPFRASDSTTLLSDAFGWGDSARQVFELWGSASSQSQTERVETKPVSDV